MHVEDFDIKNLSSAIQRREISSVELTQHYLDRIEHLDPVLNSYITVDAEGALKAARAADQETGQGRSRGPLHGIPVGLKDNIAVAGMRCTSGSDAYRDYVPPQDSTVARRLRDGGAVLIGKHNMHELGLGGTTINPFFGDCKNPWNTDHIPGGSSGGGAAAVAANLCGVAIANDGAGSARNPGALCGVVGFKPTHGRISRAGFMPKLQGFSHVDCGILGRTVADVGLTLPVIAGHDPADPSTLPEGPGSYRANLEANVSGYRVAVAPYFERLIDEGVRKCFQQSLSILESLGVEVVEVDIPALESVELGIWPTIRVERAQANRERLIANPEAFTPYNRHALIADHLIPGTYYVRAQRLRRQITAELTAALSGFNALVAPSVPIFAPSFDQARRFQVEFNDGTHPIGTDDGGTILTRNSTLCNVTGQPAITVPSALGEAGLPAGTQFVGHLGGEGAIFALASAFEMARGWSATPPPLAGEDG